jgi:hypothetical protein
MSDCIIQAVDPEIAIRVQSKSSFDSKTLIRGNKCLLVGKINRKKFPVSSRPPNLVLSYRLILPIVRVWPIYLMKFGIVIYKGQYRCVYEMKYVVTWDMQSCGGDQLCRCCYALGGEQGVCW